MTQLKTHICLGSALILMTLVGCQSNKALTPEKTFLKFSHWSKLGQPNGMKRFAEEAYVDKLELYYDGLAFLSAIWPEDPFVVKSETEGETVKLYVEGIDARGKTMTGEFQLKKKGEEWRVFEGRWKWPD